MLYIDLPTAADLVALTSRRADFCVSIYLPTTPLPQEAAGDRIALKNYAKEALRTIEGAGGDKRRIAELSEHFDNLVADDEFWRFQAHSLAVFATPENVRTFRLANALEPLLTVSDRFNTKPLLRAVTFPHTAYVLALAEGSVRLIEVSPDLPATLVRPEGLPKDASSALGRAKLIYRSPMDRIQGAEGQKVLLTQFARMVDTALRGLLAGSETPLILAATEPLASIYRCVNSYAALAPMTIEGNPENETEARLAELARPILDELYAAEVTAWRARYDACENEGRATSDVSAAARAATYGAVETLLVDINEFTPGTIDDAGKVTFTNGGGGTNYGVVDEIASRVILSSGRVLGVRTSDIPGGGPLAAILRYAV
jgi:hypothetical protein